MWLLSQMLSATNSPVGITKEMQHKRSIRRCECFSACRSFLYWLSFASGWALKQNMLCTPLCYLHHCVGGFCFQQGGDLGCPILQLESLSLIPFTCNWHCSLKGCKQQSQALQADLTARMWHCAHRAAQTKGSRAGWCQAEGLLWCL